MLKEGAFAVSLVVGVPYLDISHCIFAAGHVPGRPQGGRHGMVFGQIPAATAPQGTAAVQHAAPLLVPGSVCNMAFLSRILFLC